MVEYCSFWAGRNLLQASGSPLFTLLLEHFIDLNVTTACHVPSSAKAKTLAAGVRRNASKHVEETKSGQDNKAAELRYHGLAWTR